MGNVSVDVVKAPGKFRMVWVHILNDWEVQSTNASHRTRRRRTPKARSAAQPRRCETKNGQPMRARKPIEEVFVTDTASIFGIIIGTSLIAE